MTSNHLEISKLKQILTKYYDININKIAKIDYSFTDCYIIYGNAKYFIKIFTKEEDILKITQENELLNVLKTARFNVPNIIKTKEKNIYVNTSNYYLFVEKYIEGTSYALKKMPEDDLIKSAKILGQMHFTLNNKYDDINKELYWKNLNIDEELKNLNYYLDIFKKLPLNSNNTIIIKAIKHKIKMLPKLKKMSSLFNNITYLMTHGDYSKRNLLQDSLGNIYIVDFSDAGVYPASWELIRSYFISTDACKDNKLFNYDLFSKYVRAYLEEFPLNENDIKLMPYLFLYQILMSNYRFQEYLDTKDEKYLKFMEWKENMSYFLAKNSKKIIKLILTCIEKKL